MEAVKLESMHAPEHAMSSLVVAQVRILVSAIATLQAGGQVARWPGGQVANICLSVFLQVAQEEQNIREAESTVLTTTRG